MPVGGSSTRADVPHFALPLRYMGGKPVVNEQDSYEDVYDCVQLVVRFPKGSREDLPDFGITPLELTVPGPDVEPLRDEIMEWESRLPLHTQINQEVEQMVANIAVKVGDRNA